MAVHTAENLLFDGIYIHSVSNSSAPTWNTDGIDTFYTNNITIRNWDVTTIDDAVAPKANTTNMLVQDSHFHGSNGVAVGSIGQYLGVFEFIENVTAERIMCDNCAHLGYVKTWTGVQKGFPPNGTQDSLFILRPRTNTHSVSSTRRRRYVKNIIFRNSVVRNVYQAVAALTQCTSYNFQTGDCDTSTFQLSNITWSNISGAVSNNLLALLQCSAAPCTDITIKGIKGPTFNSTAAEPEVECSNVVVGHGGLASNANVTF